MRTFKNKAVLQDAIKKNITTSDSQAIKAMLKIFEYQTKCEQEYGSVEVANGVGFAATDSYILTSLCDQYQKKGWLSPRQIGIIKSRIGKYAGQLMKQAIQKGIYVKKEGTWVIA